MMMTSNKKKIMERSLEREWMMPLKDSVYCVTWMNEMMCLQMHLSDRNIASTNYFSTTSTYCSFPSQLVSKH